MKIITALNKLNNRCGLNHKFYKNVIIKCDEQTTRIHPALFFE